MQYYIYTLTLLLIFLHPLPAFADTMYGSGYKLETNLFNTFSKQKIIVQTDTNESSDSQTQNTESSSPQSTSNQNANVVKSSLSFSINPTELDFGILSAGEPIQRTLNTQASANNGLTLQIAESNSPISGNTIIPDTTCDNGDCTPELASDWNSPLVYGFGYSCSSNIACEGFKNEQSFKPIANLSQGAKPTSIFTTYGPENTATDLNFKINVSQTDAGKEYSSKVILYALPNY